MIPEGLPTCLNQKPDDNIYPWDVEVNNYAFNIIPSYLLLFALSLVLH